MGLEGIMLSKISQTEKDKYCYDPTYIWNLKQNYKILDTENRLVVARDGKGKNATMCEAQKTQNFSYKINKSWGCNI